MKTIVCKIALMFLIGTALSLLFNSCSKDPVIPENETDNKLHEDPSKMTIRLVECHLHADWNEIQKVGGPHQNPESPAKHMKRIQEITYELKAARVGGLPKAVKASSTCRKMETTILMGNTPRLPFI